jgi:hypothetical protein
MYEYIHIHDGEQHSLIMVASKFTLMPGLAA